MADEQRHPPGADPDWCERWSFTVWRADGTVGAYSTLVLLPHHHRAWYWAALVRVGLPLLSVVDLDQPLPVGTLRLRGGNLWADHVCEAPYEQWTVANETYAVALDDPDEALRRSLGDPEPVAFDLEWYADGEPTDLGEVGIVGYEQRGHVHGIVELRGGNVEIDGPGHRSHWWGVPDWTADAGDAPPVSGLRAPVLLVLPDGRRVAVDNVLTAEGWHEHRSPRPAPG